MPGGEDVVVESERQLLTAKGHEVVQYVKENSEIKNFTVWDKVQLLLNSAYSAESFKQVEQILLREMPDVCHVHNTMPLITTAVYYVCEKYSIPVVQTLHNYRLLCSNALFFRDGKVCEECLGGSTYHGIKYGCYRNSRIQTYAVARMVEKNKKWGTWNEKIDRFIVLSRFSQKKMVQGGFPADKLGIKPNFFFGDPGFSTEQADFFVFAGRFEESKGVQVLYDATVRNEEIKIKIAGSGPQEKILRNLASADFLGQIAKNDLLEVIKKSIALVFPSVWFEGMPMTIIEAFACGKPVIASNLGVMAELITDGKTGILFEPGNSDELRDKMIWAMNNKEKMAEMGKNARKEFEEKYTAERNYDLLMNIYTEVIEQRKKAPGII